MATIDRALELLDQGNFSGAHDMLLDVHEAHPTDARANFALGVIYSQFGRKRHALKHLEAAAKAAKKKSVVFSKLAEVLMESFRNEDALEAARKGVSLDPKSAIAHVILGKCYGALKRPVMAKTNFEAALRLDPKAQDAYLELARLEATLGDFEHAREILANARNAGVTSVELLTLELEYSAGAVDAERLELSKQILDNPQSNPADKSLAELSFEVAKHLEKADMTEAFRYYESRRRALYAGYDLESRKQQIDLYKSFFTEQFFSQFQSLGLASEKPVFIFGMPRSGTTLVEQIVAAHGDAATIGECPYFVFWQEALSGDERFSPRFFNALGSVKEKDFKRLGKDYLKLLSKEDQNALRVVDKMPHNFDMLWLLTLLFPKASFIHVKRDPADTCSSIYTNPFNSWHSYNVDQKTLGQYYSFYEDLMSHWQSVLPIEIYQLEYEKLVTDQEAESRKLIEYIGLDWDPACLTFFESEEQVTTASKMQVRQPVNMSSLGRWKRYENHIRPLLEALGKA